MAVLGSSLYVNEKGKAYIISDDDSDVAHDKLMEEDAELEESLAMTDKKRGEYETLEVLAEDNKREPCRNHKRSA